LSRCYSLGANSYLVKPPTAEQLQALAKAFKWGWLEYVR
jgi:CheY-like chemotaxis protein